MRTAFIITLLSLFGLIGVSVGIALRTRADIDSSKKTQAACEASWSKNPKLRDHCSTWVGSACFKGGTIIKTKSGLACKKPGDSLLLFLIILDVVCFLTFIVSFIVGIVQSNSKDSERVSLGPPPPHPTLKRQHAVNSW